MVGLDSDGGASFAVLSDVAGEVCSDVFLAAADGSVALYDVDAVVTVFVFCGEDLGDVSEVGGPVFVSAGDGYVVSCGVAEVSRVLTFDDEEDWGSGFECAAIFVIPSVERLKDGASVSVSVVPVTKSV